jgi:hypothetical protein
LADLSASAGFSRGISACGAERKARPRGFRLTGLFHGAQHLLMRGDTGNEGRGDSAVTNQIFITCQSELTPDPIITDEVLYQRS